MGDWQPEKLTCNVTPPANVKMKNGKLTWTGCTDALLYAICRNGKVVDFTTKTSYRIKNSNLGDLWAVRAANQMGGLGMATETEHKAR